MYKGDAKVEARNRQWGRIKRTTISIENKTCGILQGAREMLPYKIVDNTNNINNNNNKTIRFSS